MNELMEQYSLLAIDRALSLVIPLGNGKACMPGGRNGPYLDIESPIRNSAHWLLCFSVAYATTRQEEKYRLAGERISDFLVDDRRYSHNGRHIHRQQAHKDWCNGVIGTAWGAEGLWWAHRLMGIDRAGEKAAGTIAQTPFDANGQSPRIQLV